MKADEVMSSVVEQLIATIEAGAGEWVMPWTGVHARLPYNHTTTVGYRGGNVVALWMQQMARAYPTAAWATYKQWASIKCQVRKGERGVHLVKWAKIERVDASGELRSLMLRADPSILWSVASKAQAATDHLLSYRTVEVHHAVA